MILMRQLETDILIIGSGGAGMRAAAEASGLGEVTVVTKGFAGIDGATVTAQADISVESGYCKRSLNLQGNLDDSMDIFAEDILREGEFLGDEEIIFEYVRRSGEEVKYLQEKGVRLRDLVKNPGHSYPRGVWVSGIELCKALKKDVLSKNNIKIQEHTLLLDLVIEEGRTAGALCFDAIEGEPLFISAKAVVICSGGAMGLYPYITAPDGLTGDGMAAALRAGAEVVDMEFPMFLPYSILNPRIVRGVTFTHDLAMTLDTRALNREGSRFMNNWDPVRMEHTTRDINAAAAGYEIFEGRGSSGGGIYLSLTHIPRNIIEYSAKWFPETIADWKCGGFDLKKYLPDLLTNAIETIPACHFWNGGIRIDTKGATSIPGLYAGGEGTGSLHGANRISGNGVGQALVWGAIAGKSASLWARREGRLKISSKKIEVLLDQKKNIIHYHGKEDPVRINKELRSMSWECIGLVRTEDSLKKFGTYLEEIKQQLEEQGARTECGRGNRDWLIMIQNLNLYEIARATHAAASERKESRGAHFRYDHKKTDDENWTKNIVIRVINGKITVKNVAANNYKGKNPSPGTRAYGNKEAVK